MSARARQRGSPVPSACRSAVCQRSRLPGLVRDWARAKAGAALKAERRGASLDPFVDHARAADANPFEEVLLTIAGMAA
jgi:hypothetical protein